MRRHLLVLTLVLALPASAHAQAQTRQCPRVAPGARCVTLTVPLDHTGATPGTQRLGFAVLPATGHSVGALAVLAGGPGQAATSIGKRVAGLLAGVRRTHDLLLVDQRGTGLSGELRCPGLATSESVRAVTRCGESLGSARAFYTARDDAYDLDAIRAAVGVEKMSVLGISSGGRVAGVYARLFGDHLSRLVLDSPEPVEGADALMTLRQLALPRVLREVCWPPSCRGFLAADPLKGLATLAARLAKTSLSGTVITPAGRPEKARLSATGLYALTSMSDLDPFMRTQLPWAVAAALRGDEAPLLRLATGLPSSDEGPGVDPARLLASDCVDGRLPWDPASAPATRTRALLDAMRARPVSQFAPFPPTSVLAFSTAAVCLKWPSTPAPAPDGGPGPAGVPVLVISGREDLRTPLEDARRTAGQYPNAQVLAVPSVGHSVLSNDESGCALAGLSLFLAGKPIGHCRRVERTPELFPYVPATAARLRPAAGLKGASGRTATALGATLADAVRQATEAFDNGVTQLGGLRAGTLSVAKQGLRLRGYSLVRGVAVSGTIPASARASGVITVTGPAAVPARLVLKGSRLTGTLGAQRVRLRVAFS